MKNSVYTGLERIDNVNRKYARAATDISASQNVFDDALGVRAVLCDPNGNVVLRGSWKTSGSASAGLSAVVSKTFPMNIYPGDYKSHGYARYWNGSDYTTFQPVSTGALGDYTF